MEEQKYKYFMSGTDEEVFLGDVIETEVIKEFEDGRKIKRNLEFKLTEDNISLALEMDIIERKEDNELLDFDEENPCENCIMNNMLNELCIDQEKLEKRLEALEEFRTKLELMSKVAKMAEPQKTASSKKK